MERRICTIAVRYFVVTRFWFDIKKLCWSTRVQILPHLGSSDVIGHVTITPAVDGFR